MSVIIPFYNAGEFIGDAILSVIRQTYTNWELILVDDHSTDNSQAICKMYVEEIPQKVKYILNSKKGASSARNFGLQYSNGDIIQFLDADDLIASDKIECQIQTIISGTGDVVFSDYTTIDFSSRELISETKFDDFEASPFYVVLRKIIGSGNPLYRKSSLLEINGYDEDLPAAQDWEFHLKLFLSGAVFRYSAGNYFTVRKTAGSLSSDWLKVYIAACNLLTRYKNKIYQHESYDKKVGDYLASVYYQTLIFEDQKVNRKFYRDEILFWSDSSRTFFSKPWKRFLARVFGLTFIEYLDRLIQKSKH